MKIIIAGSRNYNDKEKVLNFINKSKFDITEVVSGGSPGVDKIGEEWAFNKKIPIKKFSPHYRIGERKYDPALMNTDMAEYADGLIAIWINKSNGTEHIIQCMKKLKKPIELMDLCPLL